MILNIEAELHLIFLILVSSYSVAALLYICFVRKPQTARSESDPGMTSCSHTVHWTIAAAAFISSKNPAFSLPVL